MKRKKIILIQPPVLDANGSGCISGAKKLSPLELNAYHFDKKHTVLTPSVLEAKS